MNVRDAESVFLRVLEINQNDRVEFIWDLAGKSGISYPLYLGILMEAYDGLENSVVPVHSESPGKSSKLFEIVPRYTSPESVEIHKSLFFRLYKIKELLDSFAGKVFEKEIGSINIGAKPSAWLDNNSSGRGHKIILRKQQILLETLELPEFARLEYLVAQQAESSFSMNVFFQFIENASDSYYLKLKSEFPPACLDLYRSLGNISDMQKSYFQKKAARREAEMLRPFREKLEDLISLRSLIQEQQQQIILDSLDTRRKGLLVNRSSQQISDLFDKLTRLQFVSRSDRKYFLSAFQDKPLPNNWNKIKWFGSRKDCFSMMMDLCGDQVKAQDINEIFLQYATDRKSGLVNTNPLSPRDRTNCKRGFLDRLQ